MQEHILIVKPFYILHGKFGILAQDTNFLRNRFLVLIEVSQSSKHKIIQSINKPKMAYSRDFPKMGRQQCGIMD